MKKSHLIGVLCAAVFSVLALPTQAALIGVLPATSGGTDWQAYYDDVADLSWTADANINGTMNWVDANVWAAALDIDGTPGADGWRLPSSLNSDGSGPCAGSSCTDSEMGNLYYNVLVNASGSLTNTGPFSNVQSFHYWSSTEYAPDTSIAWDFFFGNGNQVSLPKPNNLNAWAVQSGKVGAVPVPGAVWLFGSGLLGLIGIARRKKAS